MILELSEVLWRSVTFYFKILLLIILTFHLEMNAGEGSRDLLFRKRSVPGWNGRLEQTLLGITNSRGMSAYVFSGRFFSSNVRRGKKTIIS